MIASCLLLAAGAAEPSPAPPPKKHLVRPVHLLEAGAVVGGTGLVTAAVGAAWTVRNLRIPVVQFDDSRPPPLYVAPQAVLYTGVGLLIAGAPTIAAGGLLARGHRRNVPWWPGVAAIGAAALAVPAVFGPGGVLTSGLLVAGSYTLAGVQWSAARRPGRRAQFHVVPTPQGLALGGWW